MRHRVEIVDYKLAALRVIDEPEVQKGVAAAIKRLVKAAKGKLQIPGVLVHAERKAG